jgi:hypothetical protein
LANRIRLEGWTPGLAIAATVLRASPWGRLRRIGDQLQLLESCGFPCEIASFSASEAAARLAAIGPPG